MLQKLIAGEMTTLAFMIELLKSVAPWIFLTVILTAIDLFSGMAAARKRGESIVSHRMRDSLIKVGLYFGCILACIVMDIFVFEQSDVALIKNFDLTYWVIGFVALVEFKSILENVGTVTGINLLARFSAIEKILKENDRNSAQKSE